MTTSLYFNLLTNKMVAFEHDFLFLKTTNK